MTPRADLLTLADRCEREEPSAVLDAAIAVAIRRGPADAPTYFVEKFPVWKSRSDGRVEVVHDDGRGGAHFAPAAFTSSLDIAVTLVPEMQWGVNWDIEAVHARGFPNSVAICVYVWLEHPANENSFVRSPGSATYAEAMKWLPRLICAAALRARAAMVPE